MHPFRRPLLILIVLTIISPALLAAYGEQTPAPLADTQPRFDTTRAGSPGLARREVQMWPETTRVLQDGIRELAAETNDLTHPSFCLYRTHDSSVRVAILVCPGGAPKTPDSPPHNTPAYQ